MAKNSKQSITRRSAAGKPRGGSKSLLRRGDPVMVIAGGHKRKRPIKGKVGKILKFADRERTRAIVEGLNMVTRHQRARGPGKPSGKIQKEAPIHISRLMYYAEKLKRPVRLRSSFLEDGTKVRGYIGRKGDADEGKFVQLAAGE